MRSSRNQKLSGDKYYLPAELWTQVLSRLPVKSLLRFRCVTQNWRDLIDSPDFISMHLNHYSMNREMSHILTVEMPKFRVFDFITRRSDTLRKSAQLGTIYGSRSNDYFPCASVYGLTLMICFDLKELRLWNPSIRKSLILPPCQFLFGWVCLEFAIGIIPSSNNYKVVSFRFVLFGNSLPSFSVYELGNGGWRTSTKGMDVFNPWPYRSDLLSTKVAGHWLVGDFDLSSDGRYTHIVSFDFDAEEFKFREIPVSYDEGKRFCWLFVMGKTVALLDISRVSGFIWVMNKDDGKEPWTKWYSWDLRLDHYIFFQRQICSHFMYVEKCGVFFTIAAGKLMSYNIRNHEIHHVEKSRTLIRIYRYEESLLLSGGLGGQNLTYFP